jgi:acyl-CoA thioester hydrolase
MNGHVNQAVYMRYGEHARWEFLKAAGISGTALTESGTGPIVLELTIRFHNELRDGDTVDVTCAYTPKGTKTYTVTHELRRTDGTLTAEITGTAGLLDLTTRRLIPDPLTRLKSLATNPALLRD